MMLSFIYCWDYCWKCEFDKDVKIENYNHHDGEQLLFYQKVLIKTELKEEYSLYYCIILLKERRTPIYLIKTVAKRNLNRTLNANSAWRKLTWMNRDWTGKLQVTLISARIVLVLKTEGFENQRLLTRFLQKQVIILIENYFHNFLLTRGFQQSKNSGLLVLKYLS